MSIIEQKGRYILFSSLNVAAFFLLTVFVLNSENLILTTAVYYIFLSSVVVAFTIFSLTGFLRNRWVLFFIPVITILFIKVFLFPINVTLLNSFAIGILLSLFISYISYRLKFVTESGAYAVFFLAVFIYGFGQLKWTIPILSFFVLSSIVSRINKKYKYNFEHVNEKDSIRDHVQVFANGGFALILVVVNYFLNSELLFIIFVSSIAAVCADTWATEIGTISKNTTINILTLKKIGQGLSGGVSTIGTLGSLLGAVAISLVGLIWASKKYFLVIVASGFAGSIIDSILGASFQVQYKCMVCNVVTERNKHCDRSTAIIRGNRFINNDFVNFSSSLAAGLFALLLVKVI